MSKKRRKKRDSFQGPSRSLAGAIGAIFAKIFLGIKGAVNSLPERVKRYVLAAFAFLLAIISFLSFFNLSGEGGQTLKKLCFYLFGETGYSLPLIFFVMGLV